ncbi:GAF domain-containing protein [Kineococcus sp. SYSU DK005]|uniref:GAF domain-containing protein n=1 Tax=Kineococcus sp. SYSU DK005 TaxID=3383126 RepID=UPI003D7DA0F1
MRTGEQMPCADTICHAMIAGLGPQVALDVAAVPAYAARPVVPRLGIGTYLGVPLRGAGGEVLGVLCGIGPAPAGVQAYRHLALARGHAAAVAAALEGDLQLLHEQRRAEAAAALERHAFGHGLGRGRGHGRGCDALTGLPDRRGWGALLAREEERGRSHAEPALLAVIDLGPVSSARLVRRAAAGAPRAAGERACVARLSGRQLGVLCAGRPLAQAQGVLEGVQRAVRAAGCAAVAGQAARCAQGGLALTWQRAEDAALAARRRGGIGAV